MSNFVTEVPDGPVERFFDWVNERQWRGHTLIGLMILTGCSAIAAFIGAVYVVGHMLGQVLWELVIIYLPTLGSRFGDGLYTDNFAMISIPVAVIYMIIALGLLAAVIALRNKYQRTERVPLPDGGTLTRPVGPDPFIWTGVILCYVIPFITGLVTGFW